MDDQKLNKLFAAARAQPPAAVSGKLEQKILQQLQRESRTELPGLFEQLNQFFPKVAWGTGFIVVLCFAGDLMLTNLHGPEISAGVLQISNQWFPSEINL